MTNPYLQLVPAAWARVGGAALLVAGAVLTAVLVREAADLIAHAGEASSAANRHSAT